MSDIRAVVITVSDACSRGEREDSSGAALTQLLIEVGATIVDARFRDSSHWPRHCVSLRIAAMLI